MSMTPPSRFVVVGFRRAEAPASSSSLAPALVADWPARLASEGVSGFALVTCERAEVVLLPSDDEGEDRRRVARVLAAEAAGAETVAAALAVRRGREAVSHLFRLAAGLDSRLVGEDEIAAQLATAAAAARGARALDRRLDRLVRWALETGRRVRAGLDASGARRGWTSAAVAAVEAHAARHTAIVGTGAFAESLAAGLAAAGLPAPVFYGAHAGRTAQLAERFGGDARNRANLPGQWAEFDAVLFATRARQPVLGPPGPDDPEGNDVVGAATPGRTLGSPTLLLDLGVPPLVDPALSELPGVVRLDLAALESRFGLSPSAERRAAAEARVEAEVARFEDRFGPPTAPRWLLAAHGSGEGSASNEAVGTLARKIGQLSGRKVGVAFRRGAPSWEAAGGEARPAVVVPLLTSEGYFTRSVLPEIFGGGRTTWRSAARREMGESVASSPLRLTAPVGTHPWLLQGVVDRVRLELVRIGWHLDGDPGCSRSVALLVAGHGTPRHAGSGGSTEALAGLLRESFPAVPVAVGFLDQEPSLVVAAAELRRLRPALETIVLVRFFLGGLHAEEDVPARVATAGCRVIALPPLLDEPTLVPAVLDRFGVASGPPLRLGTRRSPLALVQAEMARAALGAHGIPSVVVPVDTAGDRDQDRPIEEFGTPGPFTDELEGALRRGEIDVAVHSAKDLPLAEPADLRIAAFLERGPAADVLVGARLAELPPGARVGTCSPRRTGQLRLLRPDLAYLPVRGAIGERLAQLDAGRFEALVLAEAGLVRLGLEGRIAERLSLDQLVPEPGQGAVVLQIRAREAALAGRLASLDHRPTRRAVEAERAAAWRDESAGTSPGGCVVAAYGREVEGQLELVVRRVASEAGEKEGALRESAGTSAIPESAGTAVGSVHLVGAGPGAPDLLTLRGLERLRAADVVVYDRLLTPELLALAPEGAELVDVGKEAGRVTLPQRAIERLLVERARGGQVVVRLKGGDPFVFGRGAEELDACRAAGVPCEVVPGLSSAFAGPAGVGLPVTERGVARSVAVLSAHAADDTPPLGAAALGAETLVVLMGLDRLGSVAAELRAAGRPASTPAAIVAHASWPSETVRRTTLGELEPAGRGLESPALVVVGPTAARLRPSEARGALAGRTIALTRPADAARRTAALLAARGARVVASPLIEISPLPAAELAPEVAERLPLARYPWLVFTSKHAVFGFWQALREARRDTRAFAGTRVAVVGPATAAACESLGLVPDLVAEPHRAEALVAAVARAALPGHRVLFPAGSRALRETADGLAAVGLTVDELPVYATRALAPSSAFRAELAAGVDALVFTSPSAVDSYVAHELPRAAAAAVVCLGPTTADAARRAGFESPRIAAEHSEAGLVEAVATALAELEGNAAEDAA